jgi:lysophospholipase L1-like esterase
VRGCERGALIAFPYLAAIRNRTAAQGGAIYCQKIFGGGAADPGDAGVLDITEQASVAALINGYNTYIKAKADSIGFAYYDPNASLTALKTAGLIPPFPNLTAPAGTSPFGVVSFDGIHPGAAAHVRIANDLIDIINAKYGTNLAKVPTS